MQRIKKYRRNFLWLIVCSALSACLKSEVGQATIVNDTNSSIDRLEVSVCNQRFSFENVPAHDSRQIAYKVNCESHYNISVTFPGGKSVAQEVGYVTPGLGMDHRILVKKDSIALQGKEQAK